MRNARRATFLGIALVFFGRPCFAADLHDLQMHLQADMAQREAWVTHAGFPPSYRVDETAKILLIDLDGAQLSRVDEEAVLSGLLTISTTDVQKSAIKIVRGQIVHDR